MYFSSFSLRGVRQLSGVLVSRLFLDQSARSSVKAREKLVVGVQQNMEPASRLASFAKLDVALSVANKTFSVAI